MFSIFFDFYKNIQKMGYNFEEQSILDRFYYISQLYHLYIYFPPMNGCSPEYCFFLRITPMGSADITNGIYHFVKFINVYLTYTDQKIEFQNFSFYRPKGEKFMFSIFSYFQSTFIVKYIEKYYNFEDQSILNLFYQMSQLYHL